MTLCRLPHEPRRHRLKASRPAYGDDKCKHWIKLENRAHPAPIDRIEAALNALCIDQAKTNPPN